MYASSSTSSAVVLGLVRVEVLGAERSAPIEEVMETGSRHVPP